MTAGLHVVFYESAVAESDRFPLLQTLLEKGCAVSYMRNPAPVRAPENGTLAVLGRFNGQPPPLPPEVRFCDLDGMAPADISAWVDSLRAELELPKPGAWKPWFPVIDYGRCTNCMQCLSFCLFDVYGVSSEGKIQVRNQNNCKTDCPACSRVCPDVAIMFPKYRHGPINGDEVSSDDVRREAMKVDISALLGGDIYSALRDRSAKAKSRFSKERDDDRALKERQNCLLKLQREMDIPSEVLASLPSPEEIRAKAEAAKARGQEALRNNAQRQEAG